MDLDTFDSPASILDVEESGIASFDDDVVVELDAGEEPDDNGLTDSQTDLLEESKDEEGKKEDKAPEPKKVEEDAKKEPAKVEEEKPELPKGKALRIKDSEGKVHEVDSQATVKVKVKGKNEFVSIEDLKSEYSGKTAYTEKFAALETRVKDAEDREETFRAEKSYVTGNLEKIAKMLDDEESNPLEALNFLVDFTGRDPVAFNKRVMDYLSGEVRTLDGMDDVERELYWKNKEVESFRNNQAAKADEAKNTKTQEDRISSINQMRESQGVTEQQFTDSHAELVSLGYEASKITPEQAVNYAVMKPHFEKAESTCKEYQEDLGDDEFDMLVGTVAKTLKNYPRISESKALEVSLEQLGWDYEKEDDNFQELNDKAPTQSVEPVAYRKSTDESHIESFDDFD